MSEEIKSIPSVRLTLDSRSQILASVLVDFDRNYFEQNTFAGLQVTSLGELNDEVLAAYKSAMTKLWHLVYPGVDLTNVPKILLSPETFQVKVGSRVEACRLELPGKYTRGLDGVFDADDPKVAGIFDAYDALVKSRSTYETERREFTSEVKTVLDSVTTTKQLLEVWPTVANFLPAHILNPDKGIKLPAKLISNLDAKLGKPV